MAVLKLNSVSLIHTLLVLNCSNIHNTLKMAPQGTTGPHRAPYINTRDVKVRWSCGPCNWFASAYTSFLYVCHRNEARAPWWTNHMARFWPLRGCPLAVVDSCSILQSVRARNRNDQPVFPHPPSHLSHCYDLKSFWMSQWNDSVWIDIWPRRFCCGIQWHCLAYIL